MTQKHSVDCDVMEARQLTKSFINGVVIVWNSCQAMLSSKWFLNKQNALCSRFYWATQ